LKGKQEKLKRKKAKPNGTKDSDKTLEKTNKKNHFKKRLKETYLNFNYEGLNVLRNCESKND